jgi:hypothetical protein
MTDQRTKADPRTDGQADPPEDDKFEGDVLFYLGQKRARAEAERRWAEETASGDTDDVAPSWGRIDLSAALSGDREPLAPTLLKRSDGVCLMYPGLVHDFHGESDTGKSFVLQAESVLVINRGQDVLYIDHESDVESVVDRLIVLGADPLLIKEHFDYRQPEAKPTTEAEVAAWTEMLANRYTLAVIDGVTDALGIWGYSIKDNDDLATWSRQVSRVIAARTGAAVGLIDHVTKDTINRGRWAIGGQAKMAGLTGASYLVEVSEVFGQGLCGEVVLRLGKDRPGTLKQHCGPARKSDRTQEAARIVIDSTGEHTVVTVHPPKASTADGEGSEEFRPSHLMERACRVIEDHPRELTRNGVAMGTQGNKEALLTAVDVLEREGYVSRVMVRGYLRCESVTPYREATDPRLANSSNLFNRLCDAYQASQPKDTDDHTDA